MKNWKTLKLILKTFKSKFKILEKENILIKK